MDELKGLISETLESRGVLNKIRAELRRAVWLAVNEQEEQTNSALIHNKTAALQENEADKLVLELIHEYLEFYELDYTLNVFESEAKFKNVNTSRRKIAENMNLQDNNTNKPLLYELIQNRSNNSSASTSNSANSLSSSDLSRNPNYSLQLQSVPILLLANLR